MLYGPVYYPNIDFVGLDEIRRRRTVQRPPCRWVRRKDRRSARGRFDSVSRVHIVWVVPTHRVGNV
jgi:hypothetical protein